MVEDLILGMNRGKSCLTPNVGGGRSSNGSKDYDDISSDDGGSIGNVHNGNDFKMDGNVKNRNDEDDPTNVGIGDEVKGPLQGQDINNGTSDGIEGTLEGKDNNIVGQTMEEAVGDGPECSNPKQLNENVSYMPTLEDKDAVDIDDNMPLVGIFPCCVQHTPTLVGPTLVMLGNERRNASRRRLRHHTIARNNRNRDSRMVQSNISFPRLVGATSTT
jgi:hypothetical protein